MNFKEGDHVIKCKNWDIFARTNVKLERMSVWQSEVGEESIPQIPPHTVACGSQGPSHMSDPKTLNDILKFKGKTDTVM